MAEPVVGAAGLTKTFADFWGRPKVTAVRELSFEIQAGEVFGLLGPNGSGKSTTVKLLLDLLHPTAGSVAILGRPPSDVAVKQRLGYLPEESFLYPYLSARETLIFFARLLGLSADQRRQRVGPLIEMVGLDHAGERRVGEFSKGMLRRLGLAQALLNDPELLILDEPTSGLDPLGIREVKDLLAALAAKGTTILLCSHLLAQVEGVCDRLLILHRGETVAAGTLPELLAEAPQNSLESAFIQRIEQASGPRQWRLAPFLAAQEDGS